MINSVRWIGSNDFFFHPVGCLFIYLFGYTEAFYFHWHYLLIVGLIFHAETLIRKFFPCAYKVQYTLYLFFNQVFWSTWFIWSWVYAQCEIGSSLSFCFLVLPMVSSQRTTEHIHVGLFAGPFFYLLCLSFLFQSYSRNWLLLLCTKT